MRIASFLASGTEIAVALGLQESIVAISHECDWPPDVLDRPRISRPRFVVREPVWQDSDEFDIRGMDSGAIDRAVREAMATHGSVYEIDEETLAALDPDIIFTQAVCEVCAVPTPGVQQVVAQRGLDARVVSLDAHTMEDILDSIEQVGAATHTQGQAADVIADIRARMDGVAQAVDGALRPRVLALEWLEPAFAPGHWVPQMIEHAGGISLIGTAGGHSVEVSWQSLQDLDPDVLIIMPCGYDLETTRRDAQQSATLLQSVAPRAIAEGHAYIVDGSAYFNRSGPRFVIGLEILAGLLHPERFEAPPAGTAERWQPAQT